MSETLAETTSLCPDCLEQVPGRYEERDGGVFLARECPDHGTTSRRVWGSLDHWEWASEFGPSPEYEGGDLTVDDNHACLAVVEVTDDCNLSCEGVIQRFSYPSSLPRFAQCRESIYRTI
jgi:uncharacterized radical SAM superfamily Fe-S cluster-containing enzyme